MTSEDITFCSKSDCKNTKCERNPLHLVGHCTVNRLDKFHREEADNCKKYKYKFCVCTNYYTSEGESNE